MANENPTITSLDRQPRYVPAPRETVGPIPPSPTTSATPGASQVQVVPTRPEMSPVTSTASRSALVARLAPL